MGRSGTASSAVLSLLLAAGGVPAQEAPPAEDATLDGPVARALDEYLTRCVAFGFSGTALVVAGDALVLSKGYGVADRTTGAPCTPATIFDAGDVAQTLTACAVLVLEQQGKLSTRDTLARFLAGVPDDKEKLQLHHLLTHTSGLPPLIDGVGPKLAEREELIQAALRAPLRDTPGSDFVQSRTGYALLAAIVESVTAKPFEEALRELVLDPAGMTATGFRQDGRTSAEHAARGRMHADDPPPEGRKVARLPFVREEADERELATEGWYSWALRGAGGLLTTSEDLWRFEQALRGEALLTKESKKKLFAPALNSFACGWYVHKSLRKTTWFERGGQTASGFAVHCARFPDEGGHVVLLANVPSVLSVIEEDVRALLFAEKVALPPATLTGTPAGLADCAGEYAHAGGARWRVTAAGLALVLEARTPAAFALLAGKLSGDQKHIVKQTEKVMAELAESEFATLRKLDEYERFLGIETWWRDLLAPHGALREARVLGLLQDAFGSNHVVTLLELERGEELLDMVWGDEHPFAFDTGPPFVSRVRLVSDAERSFVAYDLLRRRRTAAARFGPTGELELELPGGKQTAKRK